MDLNIKDLNKERNQDLKSNFGLALLFGVIVVGFAPGLLISLLFESLTKGKNSTIDTISGELTIGLILLTTIVILIILKRRYRIWNLVLRKYFILSLISIGGLIIFTLIDSSLNKLKKRDDVNRQLEQFENSAKNVKLRDSLNKLNNLHWELFKIRQNIKIVDDPKIDNDIEEEILKKKLNYKDKYVLDEDK
jgi:hypothetical protein